MSALTQDTWRPQRRKLTQEQVEERRREAERILGRTLPPREATTAHDQRKH